MAESGSVTESLKQEEAKRGRRCNFFACEGEPDSSKLQKVETLVASDRISELPDAILVHILSLLPTTKQSVKTSIFSTRWRYLWTLNSTLIFTHEKTDELSEFASFVDKILAQRSSLKLKKLIISLFFIQGFESRLAEWILYATSRNVEDLEIDNKGIDLFELPQHLFANSSFTNLRLGRCRIKPKGAISWERLTSLHLSRISLSENLIGNMLCGCPHLEILEIADCFGFECLNINSSSVQMLVFKGCFKNGTVEISAPSISSLKILGNILSHKLFLWDLSSLVEAKLDFMSFGIEYFIYEGNKEEEKRLRGYIQRLYHVNKLTLGHYCTRVLSRLEAKGFSRPDNMKFITEPLDYGDDSSKPGASSSNG